MNIRPAQKGDHATAAAAAADAPGEPSERTTRSSAPTIVVAYMTSRFPEVTQTWMLRELNEVVRHPGIECELLSLFPPMKRTATVHPSAQRWMPRLQRPRPSRALVDCAWWLCRSPVRVLSTVAAAALAYMPHPRLLVRALVTLALSASHARTIARRATAGRPIDHIHAHTATYPLLGAWLCYRLTGVPYSFTAHAHDIFVDQTFLRRRLKDAVWAIAISHFNRGFLAAYGGDRPTPVHVIRCGIELEAYRHRPRKLESTGAVRLLTVGGLQAYKGHDVLLESLAGGGGELSRVEVDLVGDGPLREQLEQRGAALGLTDRIRFHGPLPEPTVASLMGRADLFVLPSVIAPDGTMEGLPVVLMEALASGVPVVASRVSAVPELIRDGESGLLVEPGDCSGLRSAIRRILADPQSARQRAAVGRALVEREFDARRTGAQLAQLFLSDSANQHREVPPTELAREHAGTGQT